MLQKCFEDLTDKRQQWKIDHKLIEIVIVTMLAIIKGCDSWRSYADFAKVRKNWLKEKFGIIFENGIPAHDTFRRIFEIIKPKEFEKCFVRWVRTICSLHKGVFINIDGKTIRGSRKEDDSAIHLVSAWANQNQLVLGQTKVDNKSNEITAIPELLDLLDIKGCIITIDAMGCQKDIAKKIISKEADYVLALKDNQKSLKEDVETYFEGIPYEKQPLFTKKIQEKNHGRIEEREYFLTTDIDWISVKNDWSNLKAIGMVKSKVLRNGKETIETRYYISSLADIDTFAKAVRSHWGIENSLHWCLDMTFHEDASRNRTGHTAENLAVIRKIVLNLLKNYPTEKPTTTRAKLRKCAYDDDFLANVLLHSAA